jgi:hypothetical protein
VAITIAKLVITKSLNFEGKQEEFSNVYVIDGIDNDNETSMNALIDAAATAEKTAHSSNVLFVRGQIYSFGSTGPNFMYASRNLSGYGSATPSSTMFAECVIEMRAPLPRSYGLYRSVKPFLRKFLHTNSAHSADLSGTATPSWVAPPSTLSTYVAFLNNPGSGYTLKSESEAVPNGAWQYRNAVNHRQFRRGRKEY